MTALWEAYTSDLAMAVNNIHMILDCDVMLGATSAAGSALTLSRYGKKQPEGIPFPKMAAISVHAVVETGPRRWGRRSELLRLLEKR